MGDDPELRTAVMDHLVFDQWGTGALAANFAPSVADDPDFRAWFGRLERLSSGPGAARKYSEMIADLDVRSILPTVHQPTLVMHPIATPQIDVRHSKYLAEHIPNATYLELPGADLIPVTPEGNEIVGAATEEFVTGHKVTTTHNRALRTVLFTDIVDSTKTAAELGDTEWHQVLDRHDALVRQELQHYSGREVKNTGDGFFAAFEGPEKAVSCALSIADAVEAAGIQIRSGVHTGECEIRGEDLGGMAVHIGARVAAKAKRHEVLVSQTVRDLGGGIRTQLRRQRRARAQRSPRHLAALRRSRLIQRKATHGCGGVDTSSMTCGGQAKTCPEPVADGYPPRREPS